MCRAVRGLATLPRHALIDGRDVPPGLVCEASAIVRGDAISQSIAAASIIAKVTRDRLMARLSKAYPVYGFDSHKGYGTKLHLERLVIHGPCPFHRMSFAPLARGAMLQEIEIAEDC
jgi:ribonuclease HII